MSKAWKGTERRIAMNLSRWWTGNDKAFIRAPCSGGWPSARSEGDMVANLSDKSIPEIVKASAKLFVSTWSMDVKRRVRGSSQNEKWSLEELLTAPSHPILKWWQEITALAANRGTMRFLVANKATYHSYVIFGEREMAHIKACFQSWLRQQAPETFRWSKIFGPSLVVAGVSTRVPEELTVFELRSFLKTVDARALGGLGNGPEKGSGAETAP